MEVELSCESIKFFSQFKFKNNIGQPMNIMAQEFKFVNTLCQGCLMSLIDQCKKLTAPSIQIKYGSGIIM